MPWNMEAGATYLRTWCAQNVSGHCQAPPRLAWMEDTRGRFGAAAQFKARLVTEDWKNYALAEPTRVE
eukprot:7767168-Alexandrium_andersonii.AAC.1